MRQETCVIISHNSNEGSDMVGQVSCLDDHISAACLQKDVSQHQRRADERLLWNYARLQLHPYLHIIDESMAHPRLLQDTSRRSNLKDLADIETNIRQLEREPIHVGFSGVDLALACVVSDGAYFLALNFNINEVLVVLWSELHLGVSQVHIPDIRLGGLHQPLEHLIQYRILHFLEEAWGEASEYPRPGLLLEALGTGY